MNKGKLIVISGPSGCGKDTVLSYILEAFGDRASKSVSMTTRPMRAGDVDGVSYYFVTKEQFEDNIKNGKMLEYTTFGSNMYGTPLEPIQKMTAQGKLVFLNIEVEGGANIRRLVDDCLEIFLLPPSLDVLEARLRNRATESEEDIQKRLKIAEREISHAEEYDYQIVNDNLEECVSQIISIIEKTCI